MRLEKKQNILLIITCLIVIIVSVSIGAKLLLSTTEPEAEIPGAVVQIPEDPTEEKPPVETQKPKEYVPVVFIGKNDSGEEVYKIVKREYDKDIDGSKLKFALTSLIMGPVKNEKTSGIYSEVPSSTAVLKISDRSDKVIIDLSSGFVNGGGTDSVYKRLFQLIKTVTRNTNKPAYLYIDGKQADVIGGDGIMITQPLSENSIGE